MKKKRNIFYRFIVVFLIMIFSFYLSINIYTVNSNKDFIDSILASTNHFFKSSYSSLIKNVIKFTNHIDIDKPSSFINSNYKYKTKAETKTASDSDKPSEDVKIDKNVISEVSDIPLVYIYNTHQTEKYSKGNNNYDFIPTVMNADYILREKLNSNHISTLVEENNVMDILNVNGWNYASSYRVSRLFMESAKTSFPSLKYFIDLHRDSVSKSISTTLIDGKSYARVLFIVGLENTNYQENLEFTNKINELIINKNPTLSRGIYKKKGKGVNGLYNQDFSNRTILVEIGGEENTLEEVTNTIEVLSEILVNVIGEENEE